MHVCLHKNARTTPVTRAEIAASADSVATLAERYHVSEGAILGCDSLGYAAHSLPPNRRIT